MTSRSRSGAGSAARRGTMAITTTVSENNKRSMLGPRDSLGVWQLIYAGPQGKQVKLTHHQVRSSLRSPRLLPRVVLLRTPAGFAVRATDRPKALLFRHELRSTPGRAASRTLMPSPPLFSQVLLRSTGCDSSSTEMPSPPFPRHVFSRQVGAAVSLT